MLGITLILQWLPNTTLEENPQSIKAISPKISPHPCKTVPPTNSRANSLTNPAHGHVSLTAENGSVEEVSEEGKLHEWLMA